MSELKCCLRPEQLGFLLHSQSGLEASVLVTAPTVATFSLVMVQEIAVPDVALLFLFFLKKMKT